MTPLTGKWFPRLLLACSAWSLLSAIPHGYAWMTGGDPITVPRLIAMFDDLAPAFLFVGFYMFVRTANERLIRSLPLWPGKTVIFGEYQPGVRFVEYDGNSQRIHYKSGTTIHIPITKHITAEMEAAMEKARAASGEEERKKVDGTTEDADRFRRSMMKGKDVEFPEGSGKKYRVTESWVGLSGGATVHYFNLIRVGAHGLLEVRVEEPAPADGMTAGTTYTQSEQGEAQ